MARDSFRKVSTDQNKGGLVYCLRNLVDSRLYPKCNGRLLKDSQQKSTMITFTFSKEYPGSYRRKVYEGERRRLVSHLLGESK